MVQIGFRRDYIYWKVFSSSSKSKCFGTPHSPNSYRMSRFSQAALFALRDKYGPQTLNCDRLLQLNLLIEFTHNAHLA